VEVDSPQTGPLVCLPGVLGFPFRDSLRLDAFGLGLSGKGSPYPPSEHLVPFGPRCFSWVVLLLALPGSLQVFPHPLRVFPRPLRVFLHSLQVFLCSLWVFLRFVGL
jgi:hypothetical protein